MEKINKEKIRRNLSELIESTLCSSKFLSIFLSKNLFSKSDVQIIETEGKNNGQIAATKKFYDLLEHRSESFEVLLDALRETNQSGVMRILNVSPESQTLKHEPLPLKFSPNIPKFLDDYINLQNGQYLIVCSHDCKLTCKGILERRPKCKLYSVNDLVKVFSVSPELFKRDTVFIVNLEDNLGPIHYIEQHLKWKVVFVTQVNMTEVQKSLPVGTDWWKIVKDEIHWSDLSHFTRHTITNGLKQNLGLNEKVLTEALKAIDSQTLADLINGKFPAPENLFSDTIPSPISYYIPRTLQTRYIIAKEILQGDLENEVLLLSGIERHELTFICQSKLTDTSSNLIRNKKGISNFVVQENPEDFKIISKMFPEKSVPMLDYESGEFVWKETRGNLSTIQKYVALKQQHKINESDFITGILSQNQLSHICLSDTPGKGKSILLAHLATQIKQHHVNGIVGFIIIKELIQRIKHHANKSNLSSIIEYEVYSVLSTSKIGQKYLSVNKHYLRELMLDAFDEVDADDTEFAFECIKNICLLFSETRIWITSRPHMLSELERCLTTLGYNIEPFNKKDQVNFLSSFWANIIDRCDKNILCDFAEQCLIFLETELERNKDDIAGIPLQCKLIAETYEEDAKRFLSTTSSIATFNTPVIKSIKDLYDSLIEKNASIFMNRYNINNVGKLEIFTAHMRLAMQEIYPMHVSTFSKFLVHGLSMQEIFNCGLVGAKSIFSTPRFIHRTFAEYFVALFVSVLLRNPTTDKTIDKTIEFVVIEVLRTENDQIKISLEELFYQFRPKSDVMIKYSKFRQNIICYFLNTFVKNVSQNLVKINDDGFIERVRSASEACLYHNFANIYKNIVPENTHRRNIVDQGFLVKAVYLADVNLLIQVVNEYLSLNITPVVELNVCQYNDASELFAYGLDVQEDETGSMTSFFGSMNLLQLAMKKGDYGTVVFLITHYFRTLVEENPDGLFNNLVRILLCNSVTNSNWVIVDKKLILNYLVNINEELLIAEDEDEFPLEIWNGKIHFDLVNEVLKLGNKFYMTRNVTCRILCPMATEMSCENFDIRLKSVFLSLDETRREEIFHNGYLLERICLVEGLTIELLEYVKDQSSCFRDLSSDSSFKCFLSAFPRQNNLVLNWLLNNLPCISKNIKDILAKCLRFGNINGVDVILSHIEEQMTIDHNFKLSKIFEFLFSDSTYIPPELIMRLLSYYISKTRLKCVEELNVVTKLTSLVGLGISCIDELILKNVVRKSYGNLLNQVWIAYICETYEMQALIPSFLNGIDLQAKDDFGNTLLHYIGEYFNFDPYIYYMFGNCNFNLNSNSKQNFKMNCKPFNIWNEMVANKLNVLQCNIQHQTPICLLTTNTYYNVESTKIFTEAILFAANFMVNQTDWIIDDVHKMFFLVTKSHHFQIVQNVFEWYAKVCASQDIIVSNVTITFNGEVSNFLDAALQNGCGRVIQFVQRIVKISRPLLPPFPACIIQSICSPFKNSNKYVKRMAKIFPKQIKQLVNHPNKYGIGPLSLCKISYTAKNLNKFGANINATDDNGNTPLHFPVANGRLDVVDQLFKCGSNVNAQNHKMETPLLHLVRRSTISNSIGYNQKFIHCFEKLIQNKADLASKDEYGNTALHNLAKNTISGQRFHQIVEIVILDGLVSCLKIRNGNDETPLQVADKYFYILKKTKELLQKHGILDVAM